jgi:predicted HTH transcriptional regulator
MKESKKTFKEEISKLFESPTREGLRDVLRNNLGEFSNLDFKEILPAYPKLARHLLAMANGEGGCIVVGVAEKDDRSIEIKGVTKIEDKSDINKGIKKFLPNNLIDKVNIIDLSYEESEYPTLKGKAFQIILIETDTKHLPFISMASGDGIQTNKIYVRKGTESEEAGHDDLQKILNLRLETGYSSRGEIDLVKHLEQLKILYSQIDRNYVKYKSNAFGLESTMKLMSQFISQTIEVVEENPEYPKEDFEKFIVRLIRIKKRRIEIEIDVNDF